MRFATKAIREGQPPDPATGSIIAPVYQAVNFIFDDIGKPHGCLLYTSDAADE